MRVLCAASAALFILTAFAPAPAPATASPGMRIGVVPQAELAPEDFRIMGAAGIDSVRVVFSWSKVERSPGSYDWSETDAVIALASRAGVDVLAVLYGTPRWLVEEGGHSRCEPAACAALGPASAGAAERFASFAGAAAGRYGPAGTFWLLRPDLPHIPVRAWEIWNEQNSPAFFGPEADPRAYGRLLSGSSARIHAVDDEAEVLVGGLVTRRFAPRGTAGPRQYLRELLGDPSAGAAFDGVALHPYAGGAAGVLRQVRGVRDLLDEAGLGERTLWVTESGWASSGERGHPLVASERGQARLLRRAFGGLASRAQRWSIRAGYWYSWRDTPRAEAVCDWCAATGLFEADRRPKRAWRGISALAQAAP